MIIFSRTIEDATFGARGTRPIDEDLIVCISKGDKTALGSLYAQTKTAAYGFALSILRNRDDAEDVLQDTYVKIYDSASEYRPLGKPMAWILTITRNLCLMKLRRDKRIAAQSEDVWDPPDPKDPIANGADRVVLQAALEILSDEERQIVTLHAVAGQKHREIASILELPLSTTLSKYHRALSKLKKYLEEDVPNER
jgi:RNA polymerase sigma-70 factor (ECF subfamily)